MEVIIAHSLAVTGTGTLVTLKHWDMQRSRDEAGFHLPSQFAVGSSGRCLSGIRAPIAINPVLAVSGELASL